MDLCHGLCSRTFRIFAKQYKVGKREVDLDRRSAPSPMLLKDDGAGPPAAAGPPSDASREGRGEKPNSNRAEHSIQIAKVLGMMYYSGTVVCAFWCMDMKVIY